jgi:Mg2+-importing ATPase
MKVDSPLRNDIWLFIAQFRSPITIILLSAAALSWYLRNTTDALILTTIVLAGALLSFWYEVAAAKTIRSLMALIQATSTVIRDGKQIQVPSDRVIHGDVLVLSAGSTIPADGRLIDAEDLFVNESTLTGESFPVEKRSSNPMYEGTHVISGTGRAQVVSVGTQTRFGGIKHQLRLRAPETDFERGIRRFGYFLMEITLLMLLSIFCIHIALRTPALDALLFALAIGVGLTPQLLPAVISVNLSYGAKELGKRNVIVRRLSSIENLGSMNVLCSDKTGTLTEGTVELIQSVDFQGNPSQESLRLSGINAALETGFINPIDETLRRSVRIDTESIEKLDEIPYDFRRRCLSILVRDHSQRILIVKGAVSNLMRQCQSAKTADGAIVPIEQAERNIQRLCDTFGSQGFRVIAVAYRAFDRDRLEHSDESQLTFSGLLVLSDPPREGMTETLKELSDLGVNLKMITGDNRIVASSIAVRVGVCNPRLLTGNELSSMTDEALMRQASLIDVFAEVEPNQKERIVTALKRSGQVVGYIGDGVNDATALRAADVGISVDRAVDVAKQAADIVLLDRDLNVLVEGIRQGRRTFANTLKYIRVATSANFGNMLSMAGLSLFLPYLPLLPKQILLTNLLTDIPEMTIPKDSVDPERLASPQRWSLNEIGSFMLVFGLLSWVFDFLAFAVLLGWMKVDSETFRTGWFVESVVSACAVVLIVRTGQSLWKNPPTGWLFWTTIGVIFTTIILPYSPFASYLGFVPLSAFELAGMLAIVVLYASSAEVIKRLVAAALGLRNDP